MVARSGFVRIDTAALAALPLGGAPPLGAFTLDLFEVPVQLDVTSLTWTLGYRVFHGRVPGQTSEVHITVAGNGAAWASIDVLSPGFQAWFQAAFLDVGAAQGFAASDAVVVTVP